MKAGRMILVLASSALLLLLSGAVMAKDKKEQLYPNATRHEPKLDLTRQRDSKKLNEAEDAISAGKDAEAESILQPYADGSASKSKYAQAMALQILASQKYKQGNIKDAIKLMKHSLEIGVMPNDTYFQLMYGLVQFYFADRQYQNAMTSLQKWRQQGKRETARSYALEGNIDYRLEKYPEAIAAIKKANSLTDKPEPSWQQILTASYAETGQTDQAVNLARQQFAKNPKDTDALHNAISTLVQAQRYPEAMQMMEQAHSANALNEGKDYIMMAKLYLLIGQDSDNPKPEADKAQKLLREGLAKKALKPGYEVYKLQGNAAYIGDDYDNALKYYKQATPYAKDGEIEIRRGQILATQGNNDQAIALINRGIGKGVKNMGAAYLTLGAANANAGHKKAATAAMKKAAQYPETKAKANAWLRKAGVQ